jgi:secreted trypsin-like serine protease
MCVRFICRDSGGPLVTLNPNVLVGVVSWGKGCADPGYPVTMTPRSKILGYFNGWSICVCFFVFPFRSSAIRASTRELRHLLTGSRTTLYKFPTKSNLETNVYQIMKSLEGKSFPLGRIFFFKDICDDD